MTKMKLSIVGYGKMGHAIERIARERGHEIACIIDVDNPQDWDSPALLASDAIIEFSTPKTAADNCRRAISRGIPTVSGSTGWVDALPEAKQLAKDKGVGFMWSSNYSIGVNLFFKVNAQLAKLMAHFDQYNASMKEIHHIHKLDHPSGTAITLAEGILAQNPRYQDWNELPDQSAPHLGIAHEREGEVPGTHIITWDSPVDTITIEHRAKSRDGFALGTVMAAEWLQGRKGFYDVQDMLSEILSK